MNDSIIYKDLVSKIEGIEGYNLVHKLFNLSIVSSSQECIFECVIFREISQIKGTVFSENWRSLKSAFRTYLINRLKESENQFAKGRYSAVLAIIFSNNIIEAYNENVDLLEIAIQKNIEPYTLNQLLISILSIYNLLYKKKISIPTNRDIHHVFSSILKNKTISIKIRRQILTYIASVDFPSLKVSEISDLINSSTEILNSTEHVPIVKQHLIMDCIAMCNRLMETDKEKYSELLKVFWEQYGDNEYRFMVQEDAENLMVPHINAHKLECIIDDYKASGNIIKMLKAEREFVYWKNKQIFPSFAIKIFEDKDIKEINRRLELAKRMDLKSLVEGISSNYFGIIPTDDQLNKSDNQYEFKKSLKTVHIDVNGNSQPIAQEEDEEYAKFQNLGMFINPTIFSFTQLVLDRITKKTFSFSKLKSVLVKDTIFGFQYENYSGFKQTLFNIVEEPLKDLFKQLTKITKHKPINFSYPLDILGIKIERILRDILFVNGQTIMKRTPQGKSRLINLDDILNGEGIKQIYATDDLNFIKYVLTDRGLNIRNDAAHGFYGNEYYATEFGMFRCMCLLMCIIRIAIKYKYCI